MSNLKFRERGANHEEELRNIRLGIFEQYGYIAKNKKGQLVFDREKFTKAPQLKELRSEMLKTYPYKYGLSLPFSQLVVDTFSGLNVLDRSEASKPDATPRPLLYLPKSTKDAFDPKATTAEYHLGVWDLDGFTRDTHPVTNKGETTLPSLREVEAFQRIFNVKYGAGARNETGVLMVTDPKTGKRQPITTRFFEHSAFSTKVGKVDPKASPRDFIQQECPHLQVEGWVTPDDFKSKSALRYRSTNAKGTCTVPSTDRRATLGVNYAKCKTIQLSGEHLAVIKGNQIALLNIPTVQSLSGNKNGVYVDIPKDASLTCLEHLQAHPHLRLALQNQQQFITLENHLLESTGTGFTKQSSENAMALYGLILNTTANKSLELSNWTEFIQTYGQAGIDISLMIKKLGGDVVPLLQREPQGSLSPLYDLLARTIKLSTQIAVHNPQLADLAQRHAYALLQSGYFCTDNPDPAFLTGDVISATKNFEDRLIKSLAALSGKSSQTHDNEILNKIKRCQADPRLRALALELFQQTSRSSTQVPAQVLRQTERFYRGNTRLYKQVETTTGETQREQSMFLEFIKKTNLKPQAILDLGSGLVSRMSFFMRFRFPQAKITGVDLVQATRTPRRNFNFIQGDICNLPSLVPPDSFDLATMFWSVFNDLNPTQQTEFVKGAAASIKQNGYIYLGTPQLEGGENSWTAASTDFASKHPRTASVGEIKAQVGDRSKNFYITPEARIKLLFETHGFRLVFEKEWTTKAGKPRKEYAFKLVSKQTIF